jgi:uncharacterized Zn finger protein
MKEEAMCCPPRCPPCGSLDVVHDDHISAEHALRCRECGHVWIREPTRAEDEVPIER